VTVIFKILVIVLLLLLLLLTFCDFDENNCHHVLFNKSVFHYYYESMRSPVGNFGDLGIRLFKTRYSNA